MVLIEGLDREGMIARLRAGTCRVVFEKLNGELRDMTCTLKQDEIPGHHQPKTTIDEEEGMLKTITAVKVFDVNADGWRSFRVENVREFYSD